MKKIIAKLHARGSHSHLYIHTFDYLTMFILLHLQKSKSSTECSKTIKLSNLLTMCLGHSVAYLLIQPVYQVPQLMLLTLERTNLQLTAFATSP